MQVRAIVVEDETLTRHALAKLLRAQGWKVFEASDSAACNVILREEAVDLALVDLGLPGQSGQELIRDMASGDTMAILAVTAQWHPEQRIAVLDAGADDYVTKPFHDGELVARIRAVMRRRKMQIGTVVSLENWELDLDSRIARCLAPGGDAAAEPVHLTRGEVSILSLLAEAGGRIVSRERLSKAAARPTQGGDLRTVDTLIYRLRRKLQVDDADQNAFIAAVPGLGYRLGQVDRPKSA